MVISVARSIGVRGIEGHVAYVLKGHTQTDPVQGPLKTGVIQRL